jgi:hypothetical protein
MAPMIHPSAIRVLLTTLIAGVAVCVVHGCSYSCTMMACGEVVTYRVVDRSGTPVDTFAATVTVEGKRLSVSCAPRPPSGDGTMIGGNGVRLDCWPDNFFRLWGVVGHGYEVTLQVTTPNRGSFNGAVEPQLTTDDDFNGEGCGSCTNGAAVVTLH